MTSTTSGGTESGADARGAGDVLPLGSVPFTTVLAQSVGGAKLPPYQGDSWRPAAATVLGAMPLAVVSTALVGASAVGALGISPRSADVEPVQHGAALPVGSVLFTTVAVGQLADGKIPAAAGD
jgi:hypothetical protein